MHKTTHPFQPGQRKPPTHTSQGLSLSHAPGLTLMPVGHVDGRCQLPSMGWETKQNYCKGSLTLPRTVLWGSLLPMMFCKSVNKEQVSWSFHKTCSTSGEVDFRCASWTSLGSGRGCAHPGAHLMGLESVTAIPWPFFHRILTFGFVQFVPFLTVTFSISGFWVLVLMQGSKNTTQEIIKPIIRDPCPEPVCLFMVTIIAACLRPLWSPDFIEPISTKCLCPEN